MGRPIEGFAQLSWGRNDQSFHLVNGLGASLDSRDLGALDHADHFRFALARLGEASATPTSTARAAISASVGSLFPFR